MCFSKQTFEFCVNFCSAIKLSFLTVGDLFIKWDILVLLFYVINAWVYKVCYDNGLLDKWEKLENWLFLFKKYLFY